MSDKQMMKGEHLEKTVVRKLARVINLKNRKGELPNLLDLRVHENLATGPFKKIWIPWYTKKSPPRLEADLILVFKEHKPPFEKALIVAVEVKYFHGQYQRFFVGIQQTLAFSLLGFDGLSLWHIFSEKVNENQIKKKANAALEIIDGFSLPIFYIAFQKIGQKLNFVRPFKLSGLSDPNSLVYHVSSFFADERNRNPLLSNSEVKKRRNALKVLLGIPTP